MEIQKGKNCGGEIKFMSTKQRRSTNGLFRKAKKFLYTLQDVNDKNPLSLGEKRVSWTTLDYLK